MPVKPPTLEENIKACRDNWTKLDQADKAVVLLAEEAAAKREPLPLVNLHAFSKACQKARS